MIFISYGFLLFASIREMEKTFCSNIHIIAVIGNLHLHVLSPASLVVIIGAEGIQMQHTSTRQLLSK